MSSVDKDRTLKMKKIMEAFDRDKTAKLVKVIKKYEREQNGDLLKFKKQLTESVSAFLDEFIEESVPTADIKQAVKNKTAMNVLENLKKVFAIDLAVMKESVSGAIVEGKTEIDKLRKRNEELEKSMRVLTESKNKSEVKLFLEARTSKYPETKKNFVKKALGDKSLQFIQENFDYTVRLFEKQEKKQLETIKEEAVQNRKHKPDFVKEQKIVTEKINTNTDEESDPYLDVLKKQTFRR
jgi:RecA/RadA recombinase